MNGSRPSIDAWLAEIKAGPDASRVGMYLVHNGVVRGTTRAGAPVTRMELAVDRDRLAAAVEMARAMPGIFAVRAWVNEGDLAVGDDIMVCLVGGDIREHVFDALREMVRLIKTEAVTERESA